MCLEGIGFRERGNRGLCNMVSGCESGVSSVLFSQRNMDTLKTQLRNVLSNVSLSFTVLSLALVLDPHTCPFKAWRHF